MRLLLTLAAVAVATFVTPLTNAQGLKIDLNHRAGRESRILPNRVIVELDDIVLGARDGAPVDIHARFFESLDRVLSPSSFRIHRQFKSDVFLGATVEVSSVDDLKKVYGTKGVKNVMPVSLVGRPTFSPSDATNHKASYIYPPLIMTGADKVHATGNIGKGIKIGIIDTGIDYMHPALGGNFGPGFKVAGGHDFVGDDFTGKNTPVPDSDPRDTCAGHGTHVAGIIAANPGNEFNVTGVAYGATLRAYRVFGCAGDTAEDVLIDALLRAKKDGNDVINLSLGGAASWGFDSVSLVASRIAETGVTVVVSAGNAGEQGAWYGSSPSNGADTISVASVDNIVDVPLFQMTSTLPGVGSMPYRWNDSLSSIPVGDVALPIYATSRDSSIADDACNPLPANTPDLSKFATLVRRGTCDFRVKLETVRAKGGKIVVFYNNGGAFTKILVDDDPNAVLIQDADGLELLDAFLDGKKFTISFPKGNAVTVPNVNTAGLVSPFSSYGPTQTMNFKPAIAGPGGNIVSTIPLNMGGYGLASGTSMSSPHIAGIAALLIKAKGKGVAKNIRTLLQTTSTVVPETLDEHSRPHTLTQAGAGLANIYNAIRYETVVTPGELLLNDTAYWRKQHTIVIKNTSKRKRTYSLRHIPAATALSVRKGSIQLSMGPVPTLNDAGARVSLSVTRVDVEAGKTVKVGVTITPPVNLNAKLLPIVSGHIEIRSPGETLKVSYLGATAALKSVQILDTTSEIVGTGTPFLFDAGGNQPQTATKNYSFVGSDRPRLIYRLLMGTPRMTVDLIKPQTQVAVTLHPEPGPAPETPTKRSILGQWIHGLVGGRPWRAGANRVSLTSGTYAKIPIVGQLLEYSYQTRHDGLYDILNQPLLMNQFSDGKPVPEGQYKLLIRVLKITGNPDKQEDYETWVSPVIGFVNSTPRPETTSTTPGSTTAVGSATTTGTVSASASASASLAPQ